MSEKGRGRPASKSRAHKDISNNKIGVRANKSIDACISSCANAIMKLNDSKVIQYCPVYTMPCQDAIKICVVI